MSARGVVLALLVVAATAAAARREPQAPWFPHERHARLFPVCLGCHQGIRTGDRGSFYPAPTLCASCHDGRVEARVDWAGPHRLPSNVPFSHPAHDSALAGAGQTLGCAACHATRLPVARMAVGRVRPELCIGCHAHAAPSHLAVAARCPACHVPVARAAGVPTDTIAAFPRPDTHGAPGFVLAHGSTTTVDEVRARCAICHARESCARCHPNAAQLPAIAALESDRRVATVVASKAPSWPLPPSHRDPSWLATHGGAAAARAQTCANCHTQVGCRSCHAAGGAGGANAVIALLPAPVPGSPVGALAVRTAAGTVVPAQTAAAAQAGRPLAEVPIADAAAPPSRNIVHPAGFATNHGAAASTSDPSCTSCHQRSFCVQCHNGPTKAVFHPPAYLSRHAADAYAAATDCQSCHNTVAFCRACHKGAGLQAAGRIDVAFHTGQPLWLVQHGQAARQGLEACATCHAQQTCLRCHSTLTQKVNPHGPGFDAARLAKKDPLMCARCHIGPPPTR